MRKTASLVALLLVLSPLAHAVPSQLTTQGRLLDTDGEPVDDSLEITLRLLDSETGGSTLWEEELFLAARVVVPSGYVPEQLRSWEPSALEPSTVYQTAAYSITGVKGMIERTTEGIPDRLALYQDTSGTITLENNTMASPSVELRLTE
jgi:hypothetical protein